MRPSRAAGAIAVSAVASMLWAFGGSSAHSETVGAKPVLGLPIACTLGKDCYIQSYVDMQAGPGVRDHRCGIATYEGHKGVDFRVGSAKAAEDGVDVLASAPGIVKGQRDGMADRFITPQTRSLIAGRECGNGVVIDHGDGWETQYCHLKRGSVTVRTGDPIARGQRLGSVGYSGLVEFAHVHLSVRHNGEIIDPFTGGSPTPGDTCARPAVAETADAAASGSLWSANVRDSLAYRTALVIDSGFAGAPVKSDDLEGLRSYPAAAAKSSALVYFARAMNLEQGDRMVVKVTGPGGFEVVNPGEAVNRSKATWMAFAGKRLTAARWPAGAYVGTAEIVRDGRTVSRASETLTID